VHCVTPHTCTGLTPFPGYNADDQLVHVVATNGGTLGAPGTRTSAERPQDQFRYTAGPKCPQSLVCLGPDPLFQVTCPKPVTFYMFPRTPRQSLLATGTAYPFQSQVNASNGAVCFGDIATSSCTYVELYISQWSICGDSGYCEVCKRCGGVCSALPNGDPKCSLWKWPPPEGRCHI